MLRNSTDTADLSISFGGFFWLPIALLWIARNWGAIRVLVYFHSALMLMCPGLGLLILREQTWASILLNILNDLNSILFLIFLLLAVRSAALSLKKETPA